MDTLSPYIVAIVLAWIVAQGSKFLLTLLSSQSTSSLRQLYSSGSMPSSHSATVIALLTVIGLRDGVDGAVFGIATLLAAIVMYDAVMVRRSSGEQGVAIQALIKEQNSHVKQPRAAKGHQPLEVAIGGLLGMAVGLFVFFISI
jgi:acid phosphatase family membrane protein YuiD